MAAKASSWGLILLAAALPLSIAASSIIFFPLLALWIFGIAVSWWQLEWGWTEKAIVLFWVVSLVSTFCGADPRHSLHEMYKKDGYFLLLLLAAGVLRDRTTLKRSVRTFVIAGLLAAALGVLQYLLGFNQQDPHGNGMIFYWPAEFHSLPRPVFNMLAMVNGRAIGPRSHPLLFAEGLLFAWAFVVCFLEEERGGRWLAWIGAAWLVAGGLLVSGSRATWLAAVPMAALAAFAAGRRWAIGRLLLLAVPCSALLFVPSLRHRASTVADPTQRTNAERLHMWHAGAALWKTHPFLGLGPGNVKAATPPFQNPEERAEGPWGHLHSTFINFLAERGLLGVLAFLAFVVAVTAELLGALRKVKGRRKAILLASALGLLGFLISGVTETTYNATTITMILFYVLGLGLAVSRRPELFEEQS